MYFCHFSGNFSENFISLPVWVEKGGQPSVIEKLNVVKFGGSSIRDSFWSALKLVEYLYESSNLVVVVSALRGVTEDLLLLAATRDREVLERISHQHLRLASRVGAEVENLLSELEKALNLPKTPEAEEYILSFGERLSAEIFAKALQNEGIEAVPIDARNVLMLRGCLGNAGVDYYASAPYVRKLGELAEEAVPVVTGFIGNLRGKTATLGRGGSDYTASAIGAILGANAVLIMSDVEGIYTADPRLVPRAKLIPFLSRERALIAAKLGMKALHPKTLEPLNGIPLFLGKTETWRLGTLVAEFGEEWPIVVHRVRNGFGEIAVVGRGYVRGFTPVERGWNYSLFRVPVEELPDAVNEIHEVVVNEGLSSSDHSELWARV